MVYLKTRSRVPFSLSSGWSSTLLVSAVGVTLQDQAVRTDYELRPGNADTALREVEDGSPHSPASLSE